MQYFKTLQCYTPQKTILDSPIRVDEIAILQEPYDRNVFGRVQLANQSGKDVIAVIIRLRAYNIAQEELKLKDSRYIYQDMTIRSGESFGADVAIPLPKDTRNLSVFLEKAVLGGGAVWDAAEGREVDVPARDTIEIPDDCRKKFRQMAQSRLANPGALKNYYKEGDGFWICTCGAALSDGVETCPCCGNDRSSQKTFISEESLPRILDEIDRGLREEEQDFTGRISAFESEAKDLERKRIALEQAQQELSDQLRDLEAGRKQLKADREQLALEQEKLTQDQEKLMQDQEKLAAELKKLETAKVLLAQRAAAVMQQAANKPEPSGETKKEAEPVRKTASAQAPVPGEGNAPEEEMIPAAKDTREEETIPAAENIWEEEMAPAAESAWEEETVPAAGSSAWQEDTIRPPKNAWEEETIRLGKDASEDETISAAKELAGEEVFAVPEEFEGEIGRTDDEDAFTRQMDAAMGAAAAWVSEDEARQEAWDTGQEETDSDAQVFPAEDYAEDIPDAENTAVDDDEDDDEYDEDDDYDLDDEEEDDTPAKKKKRKKGQALRGFVSILFLGAAVSAGYFGFQYYQQQTDLRSRYENGVEMMNAGQIDSAIEMFHSLEGYKDASILCSRLIEEKNQQSYDQAYDLYEAGEYEEAIALWDTLGTFKNSQEMMGEATKALEDKEEKERQEKEKEQQAAQEAPLLEEGVSGTDEEVYSEAHAAYERGDYQLAIEMWDAVRDYKDSAHMIEVAGQEWLLSEADGAAAGEGAQEAPAAAEAEQTEAETAPLIEEMF